MTDLIVDGSLYVYGSIYGNNISGGGGGGGSGNFNSNINIEFSCNIQVDKSLTAMSNLGVGISSPTCAFDVKGVASVWGGNSRYAVSSGSMYPGSLVIGDNSLNYGGGQGFNSNTAGLLMESAGATEIMMYNANAELLVSAMYYDGTNLTLNRSTWQSTPPNLVFATSTTTNGASTINGNLTVLFQGMNPSPLALTNIDGDSDVYMDFNVNNNYGSNPSVPFMRISAVSDQAGSAHCAFSSMHPNFGNPYLRENVRITSAGYVGIGTSTPAHTLDVQGSFRTTGYVRNSFAYMFGTSVDECASIATYTNSGGAGCYNFDIDLIISGNSRTFVAKYSFAAGYGCTYPQTWNRCLPSSVHNQNNDAYELQISSGNNGDVMTFRVVHANPVLSTLVTLNIGCTYEKNDPPIVTDLTDNNPTYDSSWNTYPYLSTTSLVQSGGCVSVVGTSNNISIMATGDILAFSDRRFKTDLEIIPDALQKVKLINGYTFARTDINQDEGQARRSAGVVAQEVESVLPEVVYANENGTKSVAYPNMVALTIEAIKELNRELVRVSDRLKSVEDELLILKNK
jgi:hypothetical protein